MALPLVLASLSKLTEGDLSSVVATFYTASPAGFAALSNTTTILEASLTGTLADGSPFSFSIFPAEASVVAEIDGSTGYWGPSASWSSSPDAKHWTIHFNSSSDNVSGSMTLTSLAPPHLPCGAVKSGATEMLMPHIGWANAVPDAVAHVHFHINGTELAFTGPGYHDKNWGDRQFFESVGSWYWGHGRLGPYSIVWFDARTETGVEHFSAYVAKDGKIVTGSCANGSVVARPWGGEDMYPPPATTQNPDGFELRFADVEGRELVVNVTTAVTLVDFGAVYERWTGTLEGGFLDGKGHWKGLALLEEFKI
ncbi:hypothetical protein LTR08_009047 [Meristemomyces frigidus]|nr:hypothetical protein LTR08_009047 [Meristemomyces frigidus]